MNRRFVPATFGTAQALPRPITAPSPLRSRCRSRSPSPTGARPPMPTRQGCAPPCSRASLAIRRRPQDRSHQQRPYHDAHDRAADRGDPQPTVLLVAGSPGHDIAVELPRHVLQALPRGRQRRLILAPSGAAGRSDLTANYAGVMVSAGLWAITSLMSTMRPAAVSVPGCIRPNVSE